MSEDMSEEWKQVLPRRLQKVLNRMEKDGTLDPKNLVELRLRAGQPFCMILRGGRERAADPDGKQVALTAPEALRIQPQDIRETLDQVSSYSLYAYEEELRQGFITISGGHRVGISGKVIREGQRILGMKHIGFLNLRIAHEVPGCADPVLPRLYNGENQLLHTLIVSPPGGGKTTLLRDLVRQVSNHGMKVGVVDERSELGACFQGIPQHDLGMRTDVLDACPKAEGMLLLIRTMAPQVVAVDEIGSVEETKSLEYAMNCGCKILATVHGNSLEELRKKPVWRQLMQERWFERYVLLESGHRITICNEMEERLWQSS